MLFYVGDSPPYVVLFVFGVVCQADVGRFFGAVLLPCCSGPGGSSGRFFGRVLLLPRCSGPGPGGFCFGFTEVINAIVGLIFYVLVHR